jgi:glutaredoxin 2
MHGLFIPAPPQSGKLSSPVAERSPRRMAFVPALLVASKSWAAHRVTSLKAPASRSMRPRRSARMSNSDAAVDGPPGAAAAAAAPPVARAPPAPVPAPAPARPPRVVPPGPLPRLFIYDHCPFCVRVRHLLGAKNVKHELVWLANDDVDTPTRLVGRKVVPIFQADGGDAVPESMDICRAVDADPRYGPTGMFRPLSGRTDIAQWMADTADVQRRLVRPRNVRAPFPEFVFADAREAFVRNHPLKEPPTDYGENLANSDKLLAALTAELLRLDVMIYNQFYCTEGGLSLDDIELFARLRSLTIVKGLDLPTKMRKYVEFHAQLAEVPLCDSFAS